MGLPSSVEYGGWMSRAALVLVIGCTATASLLLLRTVDDVRGWLAQGTAIFENNEGLPTLALAPMTLGNPAAAATLQIHRPVRPTAPADAWLGQHERTLTVANGDTLVSVLLNAGVSAEDAHRSIAALRNDFNPKDLRAGQEVTLRFHHEGVLADAEFRSLAMARDYRSRVIVERDNAGEFISRIEEIPLVRAMSANAGTIRSSLYDDALKAGVSANVVAELIRVFSWDVDFQREIREGDGFEVFYERLSSEEGNVIRDGPVLMASLTLRANRMTLYRYTDDRGEVDYFDAKGASVQKALLKTPIDGARLSSGFGMRHHPILGYSTMHRGIDFAAAVGTPIYAAGAGQVEYAGWRGAYGRYIKIRHTEDFSTAYAHMSRLSVSVNARVRQGQVIGYVGTTGRSTGPHLHYEILLKSNQVNPASIKMPAGRNLAGVELKRFVTYRGEVERQLKDVLDGQKMVAGDS